MLFNSGEFFVLLFVVLAGYAVLPRRGQNLLLLAASWVFYAWWDPRFLGLLWISTAVDFFAGQRIEDARGRGAPGAARRWLVASLVTNLGILGFFKYWNFFAENAAAALGSLGLHASPFTLEVLLPAGISFYTFQTLSYSIDVFRGETPAERDPLDFALFVAFFPQLMAGPIERASALLPQIKRPRRVGAGDWSEGGWLIFWGLFKKVFIADNLAPYTHWGFVQAGAPSALDVWFVFFSFAIQFYCDFSGYSDMARGLARLFGIRIEQNFHLPYFATNPTDLWTRWHRTLAAWFRDYVYGPLTRRLPGTAGRGAAAFVTMTLVGLWHGAAWTYVLWGAIWGLALIVHRLVRPPLRRFEEGHPAAVPWMSAGGVFLTFHLWLLIGAFFVSPRVDLAWSLIVRLLTGFDASPGALRDGLTVLYYSAPLLVMQAIQLRTGRLDVVLAAPWMVRLAVYAGLVFLLLVSGAETDQEFFYYAF